MRAHHSADDEVPARLDLRLASFAGAVWLGTLAGLAGRWWPVAVVGAGSLVLMVLAGRAGRWAVGAVLTAGLLSGLTVAGVHLLAAGNDPLMAAAANGSWTTATVTVASVPHAVASALPAASGSAPSQWVVPVRAAAVTVAGRQWAPVAGVTLLAQGNAWASVVPGTTLSVAGIVSPDSYAVLPAVTIRVRAGPTVASGAPWWQSAAAAVRRGLAQAAATAGGTDDAKGLLPGLVDGDIAGLPQQLTDDAKTTGLTHLLAVSGAQFALLCGVVLLGLRRIGPRWAAGGAVVVVVGLVVLVGPEPSVLRAAVMAGVLTLSLVLHRARAALPALGAAVAVLLFLDPELGVSAGFALSVLATAALVLLAPVWSAALVKRGWPRGLADALTVPVAAGLVTLPIVAGLSGAVSLVSVPANLLAAPAVPPALLLGALTAALGTWWPAGAVGAARLAQPFLGWIAGTAHRLATWSGVRLPWPATVPGCLLLAGLLLAFVLALRHRRIRALGVAAIAGACVIVVPARVVELGWPPAGWLVAMCEVGQGDAMVISTGEAGSAVVVDTGPDPPLIDACLDRLRVTTVPLVIITHLHADHVGGFAGVLPGRSVGTVGVGPDRSSATAWATLTRLAASRGSPVVALTPGVQWASGALSMIVLAPSHAFTGTDSDPNNDSVAALFTIHGIRILATGDMEQAAQQELLSRGGDLHADVLEEPHHGSAKVLPAFMAAVAPRVSLIGVGNGNDYGMPSPTALSLLAGQGTTVLRTDTQGDVAVALVDGQLLTVARGPTLPAVKGAIGGGA